MVIIFKYSPRRAISIINFLIYVDTLKKSGSFNKDAQDIALSKAKDIALSQLSTETIKFIENSYGDINNWLTIQIEATISTLKNH